MKGQGDNVLLDLECRVEHLLIQHEIPEEKAGRVAEKVADGVREHWGGQQVYFTQKMHKVTASRDKQIFEEFDGGNIQELIRKYGLSEQYVYRIIKKESERQRKERMDKTL